MRIGNDKFQQSFQPLAKRLLIQAQDPVPGEIVDLSGGSVEKFLQTPEYQNVKPEASAGMLGFFTQKMGSQGFPWNLFKPEESDDENADPSKTSKATRISSYDAWKRLGEGSPVIFQPKRNLQMDLGADNWGALAAAGTLSAGAEITNIAKFASLSKESKTTGSLGIELSYGEPILVRNLAELKLLHEVYDPCAKVNPSERVSVAANQLSYFTQQNPEGGFRFYEQTDSNKVARMAKAFVQNARPSAAIGAAVGASFGVVIGFITHSWENALMCAGAGAAVFAGLSGVQNAASASKGNSLNAVEALGKVLDNQEVVFEKVNRRSVGLPFFKDVSWFSDSGPGDRVSSLEDLQNLSWIYNPVKPEPPKDAAKEPAAKA